MGERGVEGLQDVVAAEADELLVVVGRAEARMAERVLRGLATRELAGCADAVVLRQLRLVLVKALEQDAALASVL